MTIGGMSSTPCAAPGLPPAARLVALSLLTRTDAGTAEIPAKHSPSLAVQARDTGLSRRKVIYSLDVLESDGWLTRRRDLERARKDKQPTRYRLHIPASARAALVHGMHQPASAPRAPELVHDVHGASAPRAPSQTLSQTSVRSARGRGPADIIRAAFPDATDDEIEILTKDKIGNGARSLRAVLRHEIGEGTLRLPCDRDGTRRHSEACRVGDSRGCGMNLCACRCHIEPAKATPPQEGTTP